MTPEEKLAEYKAAWVKQVVSEIGTDRVPTARRIVELAEINGLFDPLKILYAVNEADAVLNLPHEVIKELRPTRNRPWNARR